MHKHMLHKSIKTVLLVIAIGILLVQSWHGIESGISIVIAIGLGIIGFYFGKLTCGEHQGRDLTLTLLLFAVLNFLHSLIDGITGSAAHSSWLAIGIHEVVRQTALYGILFSLLSQFPAIKPHIKYAASFAAITGLWIAGMAVGSFLGDAAASVEIIHDYLALAGFLLIGDIIHHIWDTYHHSHEKTA